MIIWIVVGLIVAAIVGVIIFYLMRFLKGRIRIEMNRTAFQAGESVNGKITVLAKKEIDSSCLLVAVIGTEHREYKERDQTRSESTEIFRNEQRLHEAKTYSPEESGEFDFEVQGPNQIPQSSGIGGMLQSGLNMLSNRKQYVKWHVEARLDCKGLDLVATKNISLS